MSYSAAQNFLTNRAVDDEGSFLGCRSTFSIPASVTKPFTGSPQCEAVYVINKSGGTLARGRRVVAHTNAVYCPGVAVAGLAGVGNSGPFAGVVNPFLASATVAADSGFWLITRGLTKIGYDGAATIAVGDKLAPAANGCVKEFDYETQLLEDFCGYAASAITSGSEGDLFWAYLKSVYTY